LGTRDSNALEEHVVEGHQDALASGSTRLPVDHVRWVLDNVLAQAETQSPETHCARRYEQNLPALELQLLDGLHQCPDAGQGQRSVRVGHDRRANLQPPDVRTKNDDTHAGQYIGIIATGQNRRGRRSLC